MNTNQTVAQLKSLKLNGMAEAYQSIQTLPLQDKPTLDHCIARMAEAEIQYRTESKMKLFLKLSKLRYNAVLEDIHCTTDRNLSKEMILSLADCGFIRRAENVLITGATGCGKSFIACALGRQACAMGYRTYYFGMNRFLEKIAQAKLDGTYVKLLNNVEKADLIILDDFGLHPMDTNTRLALLQILEDRYGRKSMIIASQLPVANWHSYIGDATLADAIMDRVTGNAHRFELKGESLRRK
jgi:DNA replication protein DnaC